MEDKRWEKIERIFNQAVLISGKRRASFVAQSCGGDGNLFKQVISLLSTDGKPDETLDQPVFPIVAKLLEEEDSRFLKKPVFASYKSRKILGRGGMGAVFLAEDTRLGRLVAVKVLHSSVMDNAENILRFEIEARAASAISHHNVAHIYEFGAHEGIYFLAMEYVPGKTLRELLEEKQIGLKCAVNVALQVAEALKAAHKEGIIHRDIKPENVIWTGDGLAKVLDFGLAKLSEKNIRKKLRRSKPSRAFSSAQPLICRPNSFAAARSTRERICGAWAFYFTKCSKANARSTAARRRTFKPRFC